MSIKRDNRKYIGATNLTFLMSRITSTRVPSNHLNVQKKEQKTLIHPSDGSFFVFLTFFSDISFFFFYLEGSRASGKHMSIFGLCAERGRPSFTAAVTSFWGEKTGPLNQEKNWQHKWIILKIYKTQNRAGQTIKQNLKKTYPEEWVINTKGEKLFNVDTDKPFFPWFCPNMIYLKRSVGRVGLDSKMSQFSIADIKCYETSSS